ncbi:uncharacterized protein [Ptychodera flava]|uniref:uncharacterized protein isoform X2 n=1 Tax=Ptychodera flava TaxID=63121 RepID=UPI003969DEDF
MYIQFLSFVIAVGIHFTGAANVGNSCEFDGSFATCNSSFHSYHVNTQTYVDRCKKPPTALVDVTVPRLAVSHQYEFEEGEQELDIDKWIGLRIHVFVRHETLHGVRVQVDYHIYSQPMGLLYDHMFEVDRYKCPEMETVPETLSSGVKVAIAIAVVVVFVAVILLLLNIYLRKKKSAALIDSNLVTNMEPNAVDLRSHFAVKFDNLQLGTDESAPPIEQVVTMANVTRPRPKQGAPVSSLGEPAAP